MECYPNRRQLYVHDCSSSMLFEVPEGYLQVFSCSDLIHANYVFKSAQERVKQDLQLLNAHTADIKGFYVSFYFVWSSGNYLRDSDIAVHQNFYELSTEADVVADIMSEMFQCRVAVEEVSIHSIATVLVQCSLTHPNIHRPILEYVHDTVCQLSTIQHIKDIEDLSPSLHHYMRTREDNKQDFGILASNLQARWAADMSDLSVGLQLARVLCLNLARYDDAIKVLQECMKVSKTADEQWKIQVTMTGVLVYRGDYNSAESQCISLLDYFPNYFQEDELYWKLVHFWAESCLIQYSEIDIKRYQVFKQRRFEIKTTMGRIYRGLVKCSLSTSSYRSMRSAKKVSFLCLHNYPTSILTAVSLYKLSRFTLESQCIVRLIPTFLLLKEYYPYSTVYAIIINAAIIDKILSEAEFADILRLVGRYYPISELFSYIYRTWNESQPSEFICFLLLYYIEKFMQNPYEQISALLKLQFVLKNKFNMKMTERMTIALVQREKVDNEDNMTDVRSCYDL